MNYQFETQIDETIEGFCLMKKLNQMCINNDDKCQFLYPKLNIDDKNECFIAIEHPSENGGICYHILRYLGDIHFIYDPNLCVNLLCDLQVLEGDVLDCINDYISKL